MELVDVFVLVFVTILIVFYVKNLYIEVAYVKSTVDNRYYVVRKLPDQQQAADLLALINKDMIKLARHMIAKYPQNTSILQLYENYNPNAVSEGSPIRGYTSYSIDKGKKLILCIRQNNLEFVDKNVVMYVAIHEMAHIMTKEIGHTDSFWQNFRFLVEEAMSIGVYTKVDYSKDPQDYCGIKIQSSIV